MDVVFYNPSQPRCGVHQYGKRFFELLKLIPGIKPHYQEVPSYGATINPDWADIAIYNVHQGIGNVMKVAPFPLMKHVKQIGIYHDDGMDQPFDAWIFSAPSSAIQKDNLYLIGRPLPIKQSSPRVHDPLKPDCLVVGLHGLAGAWATQMASVVANQCPPDTIIRMALPPADHSTANPYGADQELKALFGDRVEITHDFMEEDALVQWLVRNDINCYIRPPLGSLGVSSALDLALAAKRPIALNKHPMFRHFNNCSPSVFVEDLSIPQIHSNGLLPLISMYERHDPWHVAKEIQAILLKVAA